MHKEEKILSICIPTYNRVRYLEISLLSIFKQMTPELLDEVELLISDNNSQDETPKLVADYIDKGFIFRYVRNETNIGASKNFLQCMKMAKGKYILLLGDDDILLPDAIDTLVRALKKNDWGCVYLIVDASNGEIVNYTDRESFFRRVSYMITYISGMLFRKEAVELVENKEKYIETHLFQIPFYIQSALLKNNNGIINKQILNYGLAANTNGGYNFFQVFVMNYLEIWTEFLNKKKISQLTFKYLKKDMYISYIRYYVLLLLFNKEKIKNKSIVNGRGYGVDNAWRILFRYYGKEYYFYKSLVWCLYKSFGHRLSNLLKMVIERFTK